MRLRELHIDGFGHFCGFHVADLPAGLVLLHGPNEAGKSTLFEFVLHVLFGAASRGAKPVALAGGRLGGRLLLDLPDGVATIERFERPVLYGSGFSVEGDDAVRARLGLLDRASYRAMFAFGQGDLAGLEKLGDDDLRERLFSGALVGAGKSVKAARAELRKRLEALWRPRADSEVGDLLRQVKQLDGQLAEARDKVGRLQVLRSDVQRLSGSIDEARQRGESARRAALRFEGLLRAAKHFAAERAVTAALDALPGARSLGAELLEEQRKLRESERVQQGQIVTLEQRVEETTAAIQTAEQAGALVSVESAIQQLNAAAEGAPEQALREGTSQRDAADGRLRAALTELDVPDVTALRAIALTPTALAALRDAAKDARAAGTALQELGAAEGHVELARRAVAEEQARRDQVERDREAETLEDEVKALGRDESRVEAARHRAEESSARLAGLDAARALTLDDLGGEPPSSGIRTELGARDALRRDVTGWRASISSSEAVLAQSKGARDRFGERLAKERAALREHDAVEYVALDGEALRPVESQLEAAVAAYHRMANAKGAAERGRARVEHLRGELGPLAVELREASYGFVLAERVALERASHVVREAIGARALAEQELQRRVEEAQGPEVSIPVVEVDDAQKRLVLLRTADAAVRERDDARYRQRAGTGASPKARGAGVVFALVLLVVGVLAIVSGSLPLGVVIVIFALVLAAGAWFGLAPGAADPDDSRAKSSEEAAVAALAAAGLPADAGATALARASAEAEGQREAQQGEIERARAQRELRAERSRALQRAQQEAEGARERERVAREQWRATLAASHLPEQLEPDALDHLLLKLPSLVEQLRELARVQDEHDEGQAAWSAWCANATALATTLTRPPPRTPDDARALVNALTELQRRNSQRAQERERLCGAVQRLEEELSEADRQLEGVERARRALAEREAELRDAARAAGVPDGCALDGAADWLGRVAELRTLDEQRLRAASEHRQASEEVSAWEARFGGAQARLGGASTSLRELTARCDGSLEARAAWQRHDQELQLRQRRLDDAERQAAEAKLRSDHARKADERWQRARQDARLPTCRPEDLDIVLGSLERARVAADEVARSEAQVVSAQERLDALLRTAGDVSRSLGRRAPVDGAGAQHLARELASELLSAREALRRRDGAREREAKLQGELESARDALDATCRRIEALHATAGVGSDQELDDAVRVEERRRTLQAEQDCTRVAQREALGAFAEDGETRELLASGDRALWESDHASARQALTNAEGEREAAIESKTKTHREIDELQGSTTIPTLEAERSSALAALARKRLELAEVVLADALLDRTLARFREAHQPAVLKLASHYLAAATGGRYREVIASDDGGELIVEDNAGGRRTGAQLSRGMGEMLYIALRMGLATDYGERHLPMPLLLDDILVNQDPERAEGIARLLVEVTKRHQVLVMTCRPETKALFQHHLPQARVVELARYAGRDTPVSAPVLASAGPDELEPAVKALHEVLAASNETWFSRAQLLERTRIAEAAWTSAIKRLVELGLVDQQGAGRGRAYRAR